MLMIRRLPFWLWRFELVRMGWVVIGFAYSTETAEGWRLWSKVVLWVPARMPTS